MSPALRLLLVEDSPSDAKLILTELRQLGRPLESERVESARDLRAALEHHLWDLVIADWNLPSFTAPEALAIVQEREPDLPFLIVSGSIGEEIAVEAMRAGAHDFFLKGKLTRLGAAVERELREAQVRKARRQSELALVESERRYRQIVETAFETILLYDTMGRITFANDRVTALLGFTPQELVGSDQSIMGVAPEQTEERLARRRAGLADEYEAEVRHKDGTPVTVRVSARPMLDEGGKLQGVLGLVSDLSAQRRAESQLRASESRLRALDESGIVGLVVADIHGNTFEANDAYLRIIGQSREDLLAGRVRWADLTPPEWHESDQRAVEQLQDRGVALPWEKELFRKEGGRVPVLIGVAMLEGQRCIAYVVDLTEQKRAEAALAKSEDQVRQLQKMDAIGSLAGGIAHDFNNILSVIISLAQMNLADLPEQDPMRADLGEIHQAGLRAAALTRQLLLFSRQEVMETTVLDLNELVTGMEKMLHRIVGEDVALSLRTAPSPLWVRANAGHLEQVVMNLVVNARDAMPRGGPLTIEIRDAVEGEKPQTGQTAEASMAGATLAVTDSGTGMDRATQARIFEPFFTTKERGKGTGLGLSTVFGIVRQSGGSVMVDSELGHGSTFRVVLPRAASAVVVRDVPAATLPEHRGGERILVVDDDDAVRSVVRDILLRAGYAVIEARNAGEALLVCERHRDPLDLLVSDVVMPQMSGPELARRLVQARPGLKVLCMSGYADEAISRHGADGAGLAFLQKPITPETLARRVREVLDASPSGEAVLPA